MKYTLKNKDKVVLEFEVETIVEKGDGTFLMMTMMCIECENNAIK